MSEQQNGVNKFVGSTTMGDALKVVGFLITIIGLWVSLSSKVDTVIEQNRYILQKMNQHDDQISTLRERTAKLEGKP